MRDAGEAIRAAYPQALATLTRVLGSLDAGSDALHVAVERALARWPKEFPNNPVAWLVHTARNHAIDQVRRQVVHDRFAAVAVNAARPEVDAIDALAPELRDDMLRLIFTCCHPRLSPDSQVALTLRTVVGLSVDEIARAYLVPPKSMERRLTRARIALREAEIPYEVPTAEALPARVAAACAVIVSLFDQGYTYPVDCPYLRPELCALAIRLARLLARMFPQDAEVAGLLALLLLQHARMAARTVSERTFVSLEDQDRSLWDQAMILEGRALMQRALRRGDLGPYQLQGAIAATHCAAATFEQTAWDEIAALYKLLHDFRPTATVALNQCVAVAKAHGAAVGLAMLANLPAEHQRRLEGHHRYFAVRGHLLEELGQVQSARDAFAKAAALGPGPVEREFLEAKLRTLGAQ
ncbi:MAG: hypothetical protein JKY37_05940 [Nannocystaceae bacterium]|nr:hypothetical protein [Nannocystaceae bacterium]